MGVGLCLDYVFPEVVPALGALSFPAVLQSWPGLLHSHAVVWLHQPPPSFSFCCFNPPCLQHLCPRCATLHPGAHPHPLDPPPVPSLPRLHFQIAFPDPNCALTGACCTGTRAWVRLPGWIQPRVASAFVTARGDPQLIIDYHTGIFLLRSALVHPASLHLAPRAMQVFWHHFPSLPCTGKAFPLRVVSLFR